MYNSKHRNKKQAKNVDLIFKKVHIKGEKHIAQMYFAFQTTTKFIMADFSEMNFMKGIVILVKVDEIYKILKSTLANDFWSRGGNE